MSSSVSRFRCLRFFAVLFWAGRELSEEKLRRQILTRSSKRSQKNFFKFIYFLSTKNHSFKRKHRASWQGMHRSNKIDFNKINQLKETAHLWQWRKFSEISYLVTVLITCHGSHEGLTLGGDDEWMTWSLEVKPEGSMHKHAKACQEWGLIARISLIHASFASFAFTYLTYLPFFSNRLHIPKPLAFFFFDAYIEAYIEAYVGMLMLKLQSQETFSNRWHSRPGKGKTQNSSAIFLYRTSVLTNQRSLPVSPGLCRPAAAGAPTCFCESDLRDFSVRLFRRAFKCQTNHLMLKGFIIKDFKPFQTSCY